MKNSFIHKLALLSPALLIVSGGSIAANIPMIAETFPHIPMSIVELLTTIPSLFTIIAVMLSNKIAKQWGMKRTILLGIGIVFISGITPLFINNFWLIFISRIFFGIGIGLFNSLLIGMINYLYHGPEKTKLIGFETGCEGIGGMSITFLVGQLLLIHWKASFLVYIIAIPIFLLFAYFVPEVDHHAKISIAKASGESPQVDEHVHFSTATIVSYIALLIVVVIIYMSITVKITTLITTSGYGSATDGSNALALVGVGAMIAGFAFSKVFNVLKDLTQPLTLALLAIAMTIISLSSTLWITYLAAILCGFSFRTLYPYLFNKVNQASTLKAGVFTSLLLVGYNLGATFSPLVLAMIENIFAVSISQLFTLEAACLIILALGSFGYLLFTNNKKSID